MKHKGFFLTVSLLLVLFPLLRGGESAAAEPLGRKTELIIQIDPLHNRLTLLSDGVHFKKYPIAMGKPETTSPVGEWTVIDKHVNWGSGFGTRWIGLSVPWGIYGIHGTNRPGSIGHDASHGCIRMLNRHVEQLYRYVRIGTRVVVLGHPLREAGLYHGPRIICLWMAWFVFMIIMHWGCWNNSLKHGRTPAIALGCGLCTTPLFNCLDALPPESGA